MSASSPWPPPSDGIRGAVPAFRREREDLEAILRHADAVFELRRKRAIAGDRRPAVIQNLHAETAEIDHGLDGEEHSGLQRDALTGPPIMHDIRQGVEDTAKSMPAEVAHDR